MTGWNHRVEMNGRSFRKGLDDRQMSNTNPAKGPKALGATSDKDIVYLKPDRLDERRLCWLD